MRSKLVRLRGLMQRYRVDRRLPPQVLELFRETAGLRRREAKSLRGAERGDVLGRIARSSISSDSGDGALDTARLGERQLTVAGPLPCSTSQLGHEVASAVVEALQEGGIRPFAVDRAEDGLEFGIHLSDRDAAGRLLVAGLDQPGWYLEWLDGSRRGLLPIGEAMANRHVRRARHWSVFRAHAWGAAAIGSQQATQISFWELGTSRRYERIGTRGLERFDPRSEATTELVDGRPYPGNSAFPVGANFEYVVDPIDIVYTWVDGADPEWIESFRETARAAGRSVDEIALDSARYRSRDELRYSLRSVWAYCGWVRKIWIVTAGQAPEWLAEHDRIELVDHADILPPDALPTFNSHAIESALHHIDGLAEHFIYFNDDMAVGRPVRPELFFTPNGLARVFQSGARVEGAEGDQSLAVDTGARRGRELLAQRFGRVMTGKPYHAPYPLRRSTMERMEAEFAGIVATTAHSRFRAPSDLSIAASFAGHYGIASAESVLGEIDTEYVHVESGRLQWHLDRIRLSERFDTFCINETQAGVGGAVDREDRIAQFYETMFPIPAPWERDQQ